MRKRIAAATMSMVGLALAAGIVYAQTPTTSPGTSPTTTPYPSPFPSPTGTTTPAGAPTTGGGGMAR